ncbi:MAG: type II toxin-antitoxin system VapC family toxin [Planctomycetes bacterium]|jgi:tRNA(fMet)-specific endonuclease VapC|nr:type II toxin-antitoxin system VapC family toxin [Planctomycetota bacterium]
MILFDTDILSLSNVGNVRIRKRAAQEKDTIGITVITRIEVLLGRFDAILKAADGEQLQRAQARLIQSDRELATLRIVPINAAVGAEFDRLRVNKKLKVIGRRDLLIACIALANQATLVTRNLKHLRLVPGLKVDNWAD